MSAQPDDGGPAFPHSTDDATAIYQKGMTLRDYFAAAALKSGKYIYTIDQRNRTAEMCYQVADAMLAERNRKEKTT